MGISQSALALLYLYALFLGAGLGVLYDLLRITRVFFGAHYSRKAERRLLEIQLPLLKASKERTESRVLGTVTFAEDLLFGVFSGISMILLLYEANNGNFRFLAILSCVCGFFLYQLTLGKLVMLFSEIIAFAVGVFFRYLLFFLLYPFRLFGRTVLRITRNIFGILRQKVQLRARIRYTVRLRLDAERNGCGLIPNGLFTEPGRRKGKDWHGKRIKKAIQPESADADFSGCRRACFHSHLRE